MLYKGKVKEIIFCERSVTFSFKIFKIRRIKSDALDNIMKVITDTWYGCERVEAIINGKTLQLEIWHKKEDVPHAKIDVGIQIVYLERLLNQYI